MFRSPRKRPWRITPIVRASPAKSSIISTSPPRTTTKSFWVSPALKRTCPSSVTLLFPHRPRLPGEVVDHFYLALEDDDEVVLGVACPKEDLPCLRHPRLPVSPEDLGLVFPQRRGPRTADLTGSIMHCAPSSVTLPDASIAPPTADRRQPATHSCCV